MENMLIFLLLICIVMPCIGHEPFQKDTLSTSVGDLEITFIGHASLMFSIHNKIIHIDPFSRMADYAQFPKADLILITHHHGDHMDRSALDKIRTDQTKIICTQLCAENVPNGIIMKNGDVQVIEGIKIEAVPAYNIEHKRDNGNPYHISGEGNGYVLTVGDKHIYIAGDTENTPEMKALKNINVAFLPMNIPYTMTPEMVADAAKAFKPRILYPYHYGDTDTSKLVELLKGEKGIEVRIREM